MSKKTLRVDTKIAEFMLDLPEETQITGAKIEDGKLVLEVDTDYDFPDNGVLIYEADEFGNIALTGAE